jgi:hypothetical protein
MKSRGPLPCSHEPVTGPCPWPDKSNQQLPTVSLRSILILASHLRPCVIICNICFVWWVDVRPHPTYKLEDHPLLVVTAYSVYWQLPPYLEAAFCIHNLRMPHAMVTRDPHYTYTALFGSFITPSDFWEWDDKLRKRKTFSYGMQCCIWSYYGKRHVIV